MKKSRSRSFSVPSAAGLALAATLAAGCSAGSSTPPAPAPEGGVTSLAEMRLQDAGGPAPAPKTQGIVSPVQDPASVAPSPGALTDAGPNTALGKQWAFTKVDGFDQALPGPPTQAGMFLSRGNGRMIGNTSCNDMSAVFVIDPYAGTLKFSNITNGSAMCSSQAADTEDAIIDALMATDSFRMDGKTLTLLSKGNEVAQLVTP